MKDVTDKNFGVIIALWLPGFLLLWGLSYSSDEIASWLAKSASKDAPTVGGFLYVTLASLALGLLTSAVRWLVVDQLHYLTGIDPKMDFTKLSDKDRFAAFQGVVENHYRYYQYYANSLVAIVVAFLLYLFDGKERPSIAFWAVMIGIVIILFFASRDALKKYHERGRAILKGNHGEAPQ